MDPASATLRCTTKNVHGIGRTSEFSALGTSDRRETETLSDEVVPSEALAISVIMWRPRESLLAPYQRISPRAAAGRRRKLRTWRPPTCSSMYAIGALRAR